MEENIYLISSGCMEVYPENTRGSFINDLPKEISTQKNNIFLALESIIFDRNFKTYQSEIDIPDIIFNDEKKFYIKRNFFLSGIYEEIWSIFNKIAEQESYQECLEMKMKNGKIGMNLKKGKVLFSRKLFDFLNFDITKAYSLQEVDGKQYVILRTQFSPQNGVFFNSKSKVRINEEPFEFISIHCDEISPSHINNGLGKIIARIPISFYEHKKPTISKIFEEVNFHKINSSYLRSLKISLRQPNNENVYFEYGSPTILKCILRMSDTMDHFYITVSSGKNPMYPENEISSFRTELSKEHILNGEWEVSVTDLYIPPPKKFFKFDESHFIVPEGENYFCISKTGDQNPLVCQKFSFKTFTKKELCAWLRKEFSEYFQVYVDEEENIFLSTKSLDHEEFFDIQILLPKFLSEIINSHNRYVRITPAMDLESFRRKFQEAEARMTISKLNYGNLEGINIQENFHQLKRNCDSVFLFPAFVFYNDYTRGGFGFLTPDLERISNIGRMDWVNQESKRLLEYIQVKENESLHELLPSFLFIYSNFVKGTIFADKRVNFLKLIPYKNGSDKSPGGMFNFNSQDRYKVNTTNLRFLEFEIKTQSGGIYKYFEERGEVVLTLKIQKVNPFKKE